MYQEYSLDHKLKLLNESSPGGAISNIPSHDDPPAWTVLSSIEHCIGSHMQASCQVYLLVRNILLEGMYHLSVDIRFVQVAVNHPKTFKGVY